MSEWERWDLFNNMGGKWYYGVIRVDSGWMGVEMEDFYGIMEYDGLLGRLNRDRFFGLIMY